MHRTSVIALLFAAVLCSRWTGADSRLDFATLARKHIVGYQGWFSCPGDGTALGWRHWFRSEQPSPESLAVDMWPDLSEFDQKQLCATNLTLRSGAPAYLFSSENPRIILRHFEWLRDYGIDGVALQRFNSELRNPVPLQHTNIVLQHVKAAAESTGRGFFIMYDVSGDDPDVVQRIAADWTELTQALRITDSPSYMRHRGKPVVGIWGIGVADRPITATQATALIVFFRGTKMSPTILGGVPTYWRTLDRDSHTDPQWASVYRALDVISPWSVGRVHDISAIGRFVREQVAPDIAESRRHGIDYMPVIFPGMSWFNGQQGRVPLNDISRKCGCFYNDLAKAVIRAGANMIYSAMFDEVNEGTALFKVVVDPAQTLANSRMATLGDGGCRVTSDHYLRAAGQVTQQLRRAQ